MKHIKLIKDEQLLEQVSGGARYLQPVRLLSVKAVVSAVLSRLCPSSKAQTQAQAYALK